MFGAPQEYWVQMLIIGAVTILFIISAWSGLNKGIKYLSNINMVLAVVLLVLVLILGPTLLILNMFTETFGAYVQNLISLSFESAPLDAENRSWLDGWTIFYWAWWISWAPFVSMFIARISKGRTVREFITGVLLVPTALTFLWFTIMGGTALYKAVLEGVDFTGGTGDIDPNTALFDTFSQLPAGALLSGIAVVLVSIFFITSADSGAFVMDMIAHKGDPNPPRITRIFWASASGVIAASLIWVSSLSGDEEASGMTALQSLALLSALPFSIVMIGMCISLWRSLGTEVKVIEKLELRLRQREFMDRYSDRISDQVEAEVGAQMEAQVGAQVEAQVEAQVAEHLQAYTPTPQPSMQEGTTEEGGAPGRRKRRNPFTRDS